MMKTSLLAACGLALLSAANGAQAREPRRLIDDGEWLRKPTGEEFATLYPSGARDRRKGGWAVLSCRAAASGRMEACQVAAEAPAGLGFGQAAVQMTQAYFRLAPQTKSGAAVEGGYVHIPVVFRGPSGEASPPPLTYAPGRPAMLVTPLSSAKTWRSGAFPCPTQAEPEARCLAHEIFWITAPGVDVSAPVLLAAGQTAGVSVLDCAVGDAGALKDCHVQGDVTDGGKAAILKLAATFTAPEEATDKTPATAGRIAAVFDWAAILAADKVLAPLDAAP